MWTLTHFPAAMRSLHPSTRARAIEIANELLTKGGQDERQVVIYSINEARSQARRLAVDTTAGYLITARG